MKNKTLRFGTPKNITPRGRDGIVIHFPFTAVDSDLIGAPEERQQTSTHTVDVTISKWRRNTWKVHDDGLLKVLFEIARRDLARLYDDGQLPQTHEVKVMTNTHPEDCPYDPSRIQNPDGAVVVLEPSRRIGFK
jgi:hypothetical protein